MSEQSLLLVPTLVIVGYLYWRNRRIKSGSAFRAYDILILTVISFLVVGRAVGFVQNPIEQSLTLEVLLNLGVGSFAYLTFLYIPFMVNAFLLGTIDKSNSWKDSISDVVIYSRVSIVVLIIFDMAQRSGQGLDPDWGTLIPLLLLILIVASFLVFSKFKTTLSLKNLAGLLVLEHIVLQIVIWLSQVGQEQKSQLSIIYLVGLILVLIWLLKGELSRTRTQMQRVPYNDLRGSK